MKLLIAIIAVALAMASPALAQSKKSKKPASPSAYSASVMPGSRYSPNPSWDVFGPGGRYVGSDPDPLVRLEMSKDAWGGHGAFR
jgi:hypothetical protein